MQHGSLFSGIGGFDLAAEWMGWENVFHCEWNKFGRNVLNYYWPKAKSYEDITKTDFNIYRGRIDIVTGGFPCQPYSGAGKRLGKEDDRHLWPEMLRAIREIQPRYVVAENVLGLTNWNEGLVFNEVQVDLENEGYEVQPFILPACAIGAPHRRDRVWFIAYSKSKRSNNEGQQSKDSIKSRDRRTSKIKRYGKSGTSTNTKSNCSRRKYGKQQKKGKFGGQNSGIGSNPWEKFPTQSPICVRNDGIPSKLDGITFPKWRTESIKAAGNAIVPQVALQIFKAIKEIEQNG